MSFANGGIRANNKITNRHIVRAISIAIAFTLFATFILAYQFTGSSTYNLSEGEVAPQAIVASEQLTYVSAIETEAARDRARAGVPTQFTPPDPRVTRQQVNRLRQIFDYIETVRADPYGSLADKFEWIDAIPDLNVSDTIIDQILIMDEQNWEVTRKEALRLLDTVMKEEIKETQVPTKRRELPNKVALDIPQEQADVIVAITANLIEANTFPDEARTEDERQAAANSVEPVMGAIEQNELIVSAGRVVGPREVEKLEALGLQQPNVSWVEAVLVPLFLMMITTIVISAYVVQYSPRLITDGRRLTVLLTMLLLFLLVAKLMIPAGNALPYFFPIAAMALMLSILINAQIAFVTTTVLTFLAGYLAPDQTELVVIYLILGGWTSILAVGKGHRVNNLLWAGVYVGIVNTVMVMLFKLGLDAPETALGLGSLMLGGLLNGIFSAGLGLIGLFALGSMFRITTSVQLLDLGRPTQPLLRQLLLKAPGTYHHSLMVSNLAEQAAERIGANALLVRVMAYYHDIGKMQRPYFFIENQPEGMANVHEKLDPQISAKIIISHVTDGLDLAKKYRLPPSILDGIAQHQGTGLVRYFFYQASEAAKESGETVDESKFRYPGPKPQTKETGILMLADVSETTVRALKPRSAAEIDEIVQKSIAHHLDTGQLDECDLTIADLHKIRTAFVDILQGIHHPRIKYPEQVKEEEEREKAKAQAEAESAETEKASSTPEQADTGGSVAKPALKPLPGSPPGLVQQE